MAHTVAARSFKPMNSTARRHGRPPLDPESPSRLVQVRMPARMYADLVAQAQGQPRRVPAFIRELLFGKRLKCALKKGLPLSWEKPEPGRH